MERSEVLKGDVENVASVVRETARRQGLHFERVVEDQTTFERVRIYSNEPNNGGVVLLEHPTEEESSKLIAQEEFVKEVVNDLTHERVSLEPRVLLTRS